MIRKFAQNAVQEIPKRTFISLNPFKPSIWIPATKQPTEYHQQKLLNFPPCQLHELVANVDSYSKFVPYCKSSVITSRRPLLITLPSLVSWVSQLTNRFKLHSPESLSPSSCVRMSATLQLGYLGLSETYASAVTCVKPWLVVAEASHHNLFEEMINVWQFSPGKEPDTTLVDFFIRFRCHNRLYEHVSQMFFHDWQREVLSAFVQRAESVYGHVPTGKVLPSNG